MGKQYMSWIDIDDAVSAIYQAITNDTLQGPVNVVAPHPVTNKDLPKCWVKFCTALLLFLFPPLACAFIWFNG